MDLPIRTKLTLLAGIPMLGAIVLAVQIVVVARAQVQKNEALASIEHVAQVSGALGSLVHELQLERAYAARVQGQLAKAAEVEAGIQQPSGGDARTRAEAQADFERQLRLTLRAEQALVSLLDSGDFGQFSGLTSMTRREGAAARADLQAQRQDMALRPRSLGDTVRHYDRLIQSLIRAIVRVSEQTDNGEILRLTTSLISVLQLKERGSQEHAILAYVLEFGDFPPGTYRQLLTLATEEGVFFEAFKIIASSEQMKSYERHVTSDVVAPVLKLRKAAIDSASDELNLDPSAWMRAQREKLSRISMVERELNHRVAQAAMQRIRETERAEWMSGALVGGIILSSLLLAWLIARGLTRRLAAARRVLAEVGRGNLEARMIESARDELGELGRAFNEMLAELGRARVALSDRIRMARELEIAASLQRSVLPLNPHHPDFEFSGRMVPADEVGGDFYDVLRAPSDSAMWLTIGDVSGHGIDSGLVMLMTQSAIASQFCANPGASPATTLHNVNRLLHANLTERLKDSKYVTGQVFTYRGQGRFVYAGSHQPTIVFRAESQRCEVVDVRGAWLGIDAVLAEVVERDLVLSVGDVLCLYTDGLPEARDAAGALFDMARFVETVEHALRRNASLDDAAASIFSTVSEHAPVRDDDWTLLLVRRRQSASPCAVA